MKVLFGALLLLSIIFMAVMQWGGELTGSSKNGQLLPALNAEKIKLLEFPQAKSIPLSAQPPVLTAPAASAVVAPVTPASAPSPASSNTSPEVLPPKKPEKKAEVKAEVKVCMEWGEFSGTDLARADKELAGFRLGDQLATRIVEYASGYWVYIPPLKNHAAVTRKIKQIKDRGVDEYFVVQEPAHWANAISLGVFKTQEAANKFLTSLKSKGIRSAKVAERKGKLKFTVFVFKQIGADNVTKLTLLQKDFANSELKTVPCKK
jgi:hypothetical protein